MHRDVRNSKRATVADRDKSAARGKSGVRELRRGAKCCREEEHVRRRLSDANGLGCGFNTTNNEVWDSCMILSSSTRCTRTPEPA
eukprot:5965372-Pleurochrysis_carterae.AAC.1